MAFAAVLTLVLAAGVFLFWGELSATASRGLAEKEEKKSSSLPSLALSAIAESGAEAAMSLRASDVALPDAGLAEPYQIRAEVRTITPALADFGRQFGEKPFAEMAFPLFDGEQLQLTDLRLKRLGADSGVFRAKIKGDTEGGDVVLSYVRGAVAGRIHIPSLNRYFEIRSADGVNRSVLFQLDPAKMPACGTCASKARQTVAVTPKH
ncbi:MAG: hypothetical protein LBV54_06825 [Puniceicoccales bacterium]|jgi:hypothetical protein|nr:hypothetical protein [Puniceicoccales bacterium]